MSHSVHPRWASPQGRKPPVLLVWRAGLFPTGVLGTQECRGIHESLGAPPSDVFWAGKRCNPVFPRYPSYSGVFLDSGATGFVTTDRSAPVSTMKSLFWSPTLKVTMGSRGPDISEPQQPYLISKSASPTTAGASSSFLALGHSFFQWPKAWHQAH